MKFKRIMDGHYYCVEHPNYTIKKKNKLWIGYDTEKEIGNHICCSGNTLKEVKEIITDYIINGSWYTRISKKDWRYDYGKKD